MMKHFSFGTRFARTLAALSGLVLVLSLSACGGDDSGGDSNGNSNGVRDATSNGTSNGSNDTGVDDDGTSDDDGGNGTDTNGGSCTPLDPAPVDQADCSLLCQTGCDSGQACSLVETGSGDTAFACQPEGTATQGDTCNQSTPCAPGFICIIQSAGATDGVCQEICRPNSDEEPQCSEGSCSALQDYTNIGACFVTSSDCEPFAGDCGADQSCNGSTQGLECVTFDDTASHGDECGGPSDCNENQACFTLSTGTPQTCHDLCNQDNQCDTGSCAGIGPSGSDPVFNACIEQ